MAEQEACTELVEKASQEQSGGKLDGESLLLPLLQGLLDAPENEQTADSGTESGEDQRNGLIIEVQNALDKLSASLRSDETDITQERRSSLLQLVTKLQAGLATSSPVTNRGPSGPGRFNKRRSKQARHTVGVSSEELADARKLIEQISLRGIVVSKSVPTELQKQNSEGSLQHSTSNSSFRSINLSNKSPVKNAVAKPFGSSNSTSRSVSGTSSSVDTPTDASEHLEFLFKEEPCYNTDSPSLQKNNKAQNDYRKSISLEENNYNLCNKPDNTTSFKTVQQTTNNNKSGSEGTQDSETDEDPSTLKGHLHEPIENEQPVLHNNSLYIQPQSAVQKMTSIEEKSSRFNTNKKLKMKRANTIDIPKPLNFYEDEDDSDYEVPEDEYNQRRRNTYLALRGPIRVGNPVNQKNIPAFEPKTDSDKKFVAFINKHQDNSTNGTLWSNPNNKGTVWSNKFGKIQKTFEKFSNNAPASQNSARNFWKSADDSVTAHALSYNGPKISRQSARNLQQMFEEKQKQTQQTPKQDKTKLPWKSTSSTNDKNVVKGSLKVNTESLGQDKSYKFVPQPLPVNKFSHAPQSAFKPLPKKSAFVAKPDTLPLTPTTNVVKKEVREQNGNNESPMYLYSPKPVQSDSSSSSPITSKPWTANAGEHRTVLSIAASKFENPPPQDTKITPRRPSKDKVFIPHHLQSVNKQEPEKVTAPYLAKSMGQTNTVRKLSGQYDSIGVKNPQAPQIFNKQHSPKYQTNHTNQQFKPQKQYNNAPNYLQNNLEHNQNQHHPQYNQQYTNQYYPGQNYSQQYPPTQTGMYSQQYNQPQNYSRQFSQPQSFAQQYNQPNNYSQQYNQQQNYSQYNNQPQQYNQPPFIQNGPTQYIQPQYDRSLDQQYTSTYQYQPQSPSSNYSHPQAQNYNVNITTEETRYQPTIYTEPPTPTDKIIRPFEPHQSKQTPTKTVSHPPKYETQISNESLHEYTAINSKVMSGPVVHQAVTSRQKSPMTRDGHDMEAAFNLKNTLSKVGNGTKHTSEPNSVSPNSVSPKPNSFREKPALSSSSFKYQQHLAEKTSPIPQNKVAPMPQQKNIAVAKPIQQKSKPTESLEINSKGESIVTSKFQIPVISVPKSDVFPKRPSPSQVLSKSDSWHQICAQQNSQKPAPRASQNTRTVVKSKSSHSLAVPKQFEAGMSRDEIALKKKTMEAYLIGNKSPFQETSPTPVKTEGKTVKRSINRIKTSEKVSTFRHSMGMTSGLSRSRTLPDIVCPELLDESNVEQAFDDLFKSSA